MNTDDGKIYTSEQMEKMFGALQRQTPPKNFIEMLVPPTQKQLKRDPPKVGRNEPCPCGSGKKFKNCHWTGNEGNAE